MTPTPTLQELIENVKADASGSDALQLLAQASRTVAEFEEVGDALLGHFVDHCRQSGQSWSEISTALGVSKQAAHKRYSLGAPTFERFTPRARAALGRAADEARGLGHGFVGTEHLLLALFEPPESVAARVLSESGVARAAAQEQILMVMERGTNTDEQVRPFTVRAVAALRDAVEEALQQGHNYIGTEHILLALSREGDAVAPRVLAALGVSRDDVSRRVVQILAGYKTD
jgi:hypothetical protein